MSSTASASRICPVCDAPNNSISLFCAECGASLETPVSGTVSSLDLDSASQQTAALPSPKSTPSPAPSTSETSTSWATPPPAETATSIWNPGEVVTVPVDGPARGMRGFYLGLAAALLIIALLLVWGWASILDDDARSSIRGFFDFIG